MRSKYLEILHSTSTKYGIKYLNFEENKMLPDSDFLDTVHLAPSGATKFVDYLVNQSGVLD